MKALLPLLLAGLCAFSSLQADILRVVTLVDLGAPADASQPRLSRFELADLPYPGVRLAGGAEIHVPMPVTSPNDRRSNAQGNLQVALRLPDAKPVSGFLDLRTEGGGAALTAQAIQFDPAKFPEATQAEFDAVRKAAYARLAQGGRPGAGWFRHLAGSAAADARGSSQAGFDQTFRMASGGRAVAENLALDRDLVPTGDDGAPVAIGTLKGITVQAIDWTGRLKPGEVKVDRLAALVPHDQHALFAPSAAVLLDLKAVAEKEGVPVLQAYDVRNPYRGLAGRYQEQMGLGGLELLARTLDLGEVAVTGGDPYFATGTDVTLLFATDHPDTVFEALAAAMALKAKLKGVAGGEADGIRSWQNKGRSFSAHVAKFPGAVAVSNSAPSLKRIAAVAGGKTPALGGLDEFKFFRQRYPADAEESAFVFLSDAAIRRWCGPAVRIAASRRTRALAALGDLAAAKVEGEPAGKRFESLLGPVAAGPGQPRSGIFNTPAFVTPAGELALDTVSPAEARGYEQWRSGYERGWRFVFDPIALRLRLKEGTRALDLSVIPLTVDSSYRDIIGITGTRKPAQGAQTAHPEAKAFVSFAVDRESRMFRQLGEQSVSMLPGLKANALDWVGDSVSVFLDDGFFWEAARAGGGERVMTDNYGRLPLGVRISSNSSVKLALFLTALRGMVNESAPGLLDWKQRRHGDVPYVAVVPKDADQGQRFAVYYATLKDAWILALDERVLWRAIDREGAKSAPTREHVRIEADPALVSLARFDGRSQLDRLRQESWSALPVLNEWHRRAPGKDAVAEQAAVFAEFITCPGGKGYQWNEAAGTMESVAFGHPGDPRGEEPESALGPLRFKSGISFEDDGLRLEASLQPAPQPEAPAAPAEVPVPAGFPQAADLTPTAEGLERIYRVEESSLGAPYRKALKLLAPATRDGETVVRTEVTETVPDEEPQSHVREERLSPRGLETLAAEGGGRSTRYPQPMPVLPARLAPGQRFGGRYLSIAEAEGETWKQPGELRGVVVGLETVETPAGRFENCVRVDGDYDYFDGHEVGHVTDSTWYAPGVGMVKLTWKTEFEEGSEMLEKLTKP